MLGTFAATLSLLLSATPSPPPPVVVLAPIHVSLHVGRERTLFVAPSRTRSYVVGSPGIVRITGVTTVHDKTAFVVEGLQPGRTTLTIDCDKGSRQVWLFDVQ